MKKFFHTIVCLFLFSIGIFAQQYYSTDFIKATEGNRKSGTPSLLEKTNQARYTGTVIYDNGLCINSFGTGPDGSDECLVIDPSLTLGRTNTIGAFALADDFVVPNGQIWSIDAIKLFVMQWPDPLARTVPKMDIAHIRIWNGVPNAPGSSIVYGDFKTNRFMQTYYTGAYVNESSHRNTNFPLFELIASCQVTLTQGHYYLNYEIGEDRIEEFFMSFSPCITTPGSFNKGNARQTNDSGINEFGQYDLISWGGGAFNEPPYMDIPFQIFGNVSSTSTNSKFTISSPNGGENLTAGQYVNITWTRQGIVQGGNLLEYSTDNGVTWTKINTTPIAGVMKYSWLVPQVTSTNCLVRLSNFLSRKEYDRSDRVFTIRPAQRVANYPNPFNPSTVIKFTLPDAGNVTLKIYNSIGQEVATLVNKFLPQGSYSEQWNASEMPSGLYFCKLQSGKFTEINKMLLVK